MQIHVVTTLLGDSIRRLSGVVVAGVEDRFIRQLRECLQTVIHVFGATARQVYSPTGADKKCVARDKTVFDEETL